eukprot:COSAG01_NODE_4599_length_4887_cov_3.402047_6_plen_169_part_00
MFKWGSLGRGYYMRAKVKAALAQMASTKSPAQNSEPVRGTLTKPEPAPAPGTELTVTSAAGGGGVAAAGREAAAGGARAIGVGAGGGGAGGAGGAGVGTTAAAVDSARVVVETRMHRVSRLQPTSALAHKPEPAIVGYYHHVYTESDNEPRIAAFYRVRLGGQPDRST